MTRTASTTRRLPGWWPQRPQPVLDLCEACGVCDARCRARGRREAARTHAALARELRW